MTVCFRAVSFMLPRMMESLKLMFMHSMLHSYRVAAASFSAEKSGFLSSSALPETLNYSSNSHNNASAKKHPKGIERCL